MLWEDLPWTMSELYHEKDAQYLMYPSILHLAIVHEGP